MRRVIIPKRFEKDVQLLKKRKFETDKLSAVLQTLADSGILDQRYKDHPLRGDYVGCRECHIAPDWLLIYTITDTELNLVRTGTHSDLFKK